MSDFCTGPELHHLLSVVLKLDADAWQITPQRFRQPEFLANLEGALRKAATAVVGNVANLLAWHPKERRLLHHILRQMPNCTKYALNGDGVSGSNLLDAMLLCCPRGDDHQQSEAWLLCALEIVADSSPIGATADLQSGELHP